MDPSAVDAASFFFGFLHFFFVFFVSGTGERGELVWTIGGSKDDTDDDIARIVDGWVAAGEVDFASPSLSSSPPSSTSRMAATLLWRVVAGMSPLKLKDGAVGHKECVVLWLGIPSSKSNHDSTSPSLSLRGFEMTSCRVLQAPGSSMCGRAAAAEDPAPLILGNTTGVKDEDDIDDAGELSSYLARDMSGGGLPMNSLKLLLLVFAPPLYGAGEEGALPAAPLSALPPTPSFLPTPMDSIVLLCCRSCRTAAACMSACSAAAPLAR
mmetsp:Transcript_70862/g.139247  ORF Transcript_70862/g.139247 Transcript_70862/m.139247 type:complete len:267 (-) Transcript_70862:575-1375(-)